MLPDTFPHNILYRFDENNTSITLTIKRNIIVGRHAIIRTISHMQLLLNVHLLYVYMI